MKLEEQRKDFNIIEGKDIVLKLIKYDLGNDKILPFYWYQIILKSTNEAVGKISMRIGNIIIHIIMDILDMKSMKSIVGIIMLIKQLK